MTIRNADGSPLEEPLLIKHSGQCSDARRRDVYTSIEVATCMPARLRMREQPFRDFFGQHGDEMHWIISDMEDAGSHDFRSSGCMHASKILLTYLAENPVDDIPFAVGMLMRHALELRMKDVIQYSHLLGDIEAVGKLWETHNLQVLADRVRETILELGQDPKQWESERRFCHEWQMADPDGLFFRYARTRTGCAYHLAHNISIRRLYVGALSALRNLDLLDDYLGELERAVPDPDEFL